MCILFRQPVTEVSGILPMRCNLGTSCCSFTESVMVYSWSLAKLQTAILYYDILIYFGHKGTLKCAMWSLFTCIYRMQVKDGSKYDKTEKIDWANNAHKTEVELCTSSNDHETSRRQTAVSELLNRSTLSFNCLRCHQQLLSPRV